MTTPALKPTAKPVVAYYEKLNEYAGQRVGHETAVRSAFQNLLAEAGKARGWSLIPELTMTVKGRSLRPDGTLRDKFTIPRGYWEAKDTGDDLDAEVRKKLALGYPAFNILFEDTRRGILYQNGKEALRADLTDPTALVNLLNQFVDHVEPDYDRFDEAVAAFQDRIPLLAGGLSDIIRESHRANPGFQAAFDDLMDLCRTALNPSIRVEAVDEMLVQHLLTERLFRTVFDNPDFVRRNVVAREIETVIDALTAGSFSRTEFLQQLDPFYKAIEGSARHINDFAQKQQFINTVYERFFQSYSVKVADTHGIVYTPQEIVDFMCASVEEVLRTEFGRGLADEGVNILDPCTGTGNYIVNLLRRIFKSDRRNLERAYKHQLFANEVMLLPYYIAAQNIEHEYTELAGHYEPFEGLCFVDTLDIARNDEVMHFMTEANTARIKRLRTAPINVIVGNPPYNVGQLNENDNNKNREYKGHTKGLKGVDDRVKDTYAKESKAASVSKLNDAYVKFFRWATDRLGTSDGIICFITNNGFIDQIAFDGMRKDMLSNFTRIYHVDLRGNVRRNPTLSGTKYNVFGIQVGVGITIAVRSKSHSKSKLFFYRVPDDLRREKKLEWLAKAESMKGVT